jgi:serine/threonine protein kinase
MDRRAPGSTATPATPATSVPERARFCAHCDGPVGRGRSGRPGPERGTCPWCGAAYDVRPDVPEGTELAGRAGRYRVRGPLVRGARGWSYTATRDDGSVVVLGRLEGPDGPAAGALAVDETEVLLGLDVPGLVRARDVVRAEGRSGPVRLLVLDHVPGEVLADGRPYSPAEALAAVIGAVPPLEALHGHGLLHADVNPSNLLRGPGRHDITVLDLGSVRRVEDRHSDVWATTGFVAPEIHPGGPGPSVASEVFALGRTLAVLLADFDHLRSHALRLPDPAGVPVLRDDPDLVALLTRATHVDAARRHRSVEAFADEARRVLAGYTARPGDSGVGWATSVGAEPENDPTRRGGGRPAGPPDPARDPRDVRGAAIP